MNPRKGHVAVFFVLAVAKPKAGETLISYGVGIRVVRNLVIILPQRSYHAKLVLGIGIENERSKSPVAILRVVKHLPDRSLQSVVAPVSVQAGVVSKSLRVSAATDLVVRLIKIPNAGREVAFPIAFKTGSRHDVEDAVRPVSVVGVVASS